MRRSPLGRLILAAALALAPAAAAPLDAGRAQFVGDWVWSMPDPRFGGFSGIEVDAEGTGFVAVGDRGLLATGRLVRQDGRIAGVEDARLIPLQDAQGRPVHKINADAEGLALGPDGTAWVSYEGNARVAGHPLAGGPARLLPRPREFVGLQRNSGLEALAMDGQGRLYAIPERSGRLDRPFPVFRFEANRWTRPFQLPRSGDFLVVGADFGPDGRLYVLERDFTGVFGFRSRVRAFTLGEAEIPSAETVLETETGTHENLEGLAVWQEPGGAIRLTLISDDGFSRLFSTRLVEYRLP